RRAQHGKAGAPPRPTPMASPPTAGAAPAGAGPPGAPKFGPAGEFHRVLRRRVEGYFRATGLRPRDCPRMYLKTAVVLGWLAASYALLMVPALPWWLAAPLAASLGLAMA